MRRNQWAWAGAMSLIAGIVLSCVALADFEVTGPDGRRILLKDDGTWRYVDAKGKGKDKGKDKARDEVKDDAGDEARDKPKDQAKAAPKPVPEALLRLQRKTEIAGTCHFMVEIENTLPYEIGSIVPSFSAYRANGVVVESMSAAFQRLRPGDSQQREIRFRGVACQDIARLQVIGGDRCVMGDLDRFSAPDGACLTHIRVVQSDLVRFDK